MDLETAHKAVSAGIALLGEKRPEWHRHINLETLDLWDPKYCVLGQAFGGYLRGLNALDLSSDEAEEYGFNLGDEGEDFGFSLGTCRCIVCGGADSDVSIR